MQFGRLTARAQQSDDWNAVRKLPSLGISELTGLDGNLPARNPGIYWGPYASAWEMTAKARMVAVCSIRSSCATQVDGVEADAAEVASKATGDLDDDPLDAVKLLEATLRRCPRRWRAADSANHRP